MKTIIGLTETVTIYSNKTKHKAVARVDTGASKSSIDSSLAAELELGPAFKHTVVKSAHGTKQRPVLKVKIGIAGRFMENYFTVADRAHMKYKILIGRNILRKEFLIDPMKK